MPTTKPPCGGTLAYESIAGALRIHRNGVYKFRCQKCGHAGENDGASRSCDSRADQPYRPVMVLRDGVFVPGMQSGNNPPVVKR